MNQLNTYLLRLCGLAFLLLYVLLAYNNRMAADDYHVVHNVVEHGVLGSVAYEYESWSGRWASTLVSHAATAITLQLPWTMPMIQLLIVGVFSFSLFHFLGASQRTNTSNLQPWDQISSALTATAILFLATINKGDTWMWWCASFTYVLGTASILAGLALLIDEKNNRLKDLCCILCFTYAGGASEPAAATTWLILLALWGWRSTKILPSSPDYNQRRLVYAIASLGISFGICMSAPGNATRSELLPEIGVVASFLMNFKILGAMFLYQLIPAMLFVFILTPAITTRREQMPPTPNLFKKSVKLLVTTGSMIFIYQWTITKVTGDAAAHRALLFIWVILLFVSISIHQWMVNRTSNASIQTISLLILFGLLSFQFTTQFHITSKYAKAYDERVQTLLEANQNRNVPILQPLPPSGYLYSAEIQFDSTHHSNVHLREGLQLHFTPVLPNTPK